MVTKDLHGHQQPGNLPPDLPGLAGPLGTLA